jgi:hypothetical protein
MSILLLLLVVLWWPWYLLCGVCRAWTAQDSGELRQASGWKQGLWWSVVAPAVEVEYGWCDSPDFCFIDYLLPATIANWFSAGDSMRWLKDISSTLSPGSACLCDVVCGCDYVLLLFYTALGI